jgi:beta-glucanase (GH16 family)
MAFYRLVLVLAISVLLTQLASAKWKMVWHDEFNGASLSEPKWRVSDKVLGHPSELEGYMRGNVRVAGGKLFLTAKREAATVDWFGTSHRVDYTSGKIASRYSYAQRFGRFAVKAKLPRGQGLWPAIWLLPPSDSMCWPKTGEIDIMENLGNDVKAWYATYHSSAKCHYDAGYDDSKDHGMSPKSWVGSPDLSRAFHEYAVVWSKASIKWYFDNKLVKTVREGSVDPRNGVKLHLPPQGMGFVLNLAVGGPSSWPGAPNSNTKFPSTYVVEYARIFKWVAAKK